MFFKKEKKNAIILREITRKIVHGTVDALF